MGTENTWYLHVDLDAFFASVEQLDHPEYRGKPLIVGGKPEDRRSVVSTASYEARKFGVHSAMPTAQAYKLCPQGIFVYGRHERYSELSYHIMNIFKEYSPDVQQMSIDEAFIDLTGTEQLFGPPEETAKKIQKRVFEESGLTVSIGLARTKYFAKIASDINKPNGFYFVEPGKEQDLMLSLPIKKVWGIGTKTEEILQNSGIKTTRDIFEKDLSVLQFITGENTGNFLYNVVRGKCEDVFSVKRKTHTISAETTYPYDISDIYTIETTILELAHNIIFRLLKENGFSKTVMIKIRYEDFTTVSIQQTFDKNILTLDDLFEKARMLFNKKYTVSRGVRLIGIGLENIDNNEQPYQLDLFDNNNTEKKQAVEKAILNMGKKHPEIKIHKARLLKKLVILLFLLLPLNHEIYSQEKKEDAVQVSGYWTGELTETLSSSFGQGTPFVLSPSIPVFKQQVDLTALIKITPYWFFNFSFADEFTQSTFSLEYKNDKNSLQRFLLSNKNISFPTYYSASKNGYGLNTENNNSPGVLLHFQDIVNQKWSGDFILRYDMTKFQTKTFYGKNEVNDTDIPVQNYLKGKVFVIPNQNLIKNIKDIFVQNKNGQYTDSNGNKYKKLDSSQYSVSYSKQLLILSNSANTNEQTNILLTFTDDSLTEDFLSSLGNYSTQDTYLGNIQTYFNQNNTNIDLSKYSLLQDKIDGNKAVILQKNKLFSPFLYSALYDCGILSSCDLSVISKFSDEVNTNYSAYTYEDEFNFTQNDFFYDSHIYAQIKNNNSDFTDYSNPSVRYPFADTNPYIYLFENETSDLAVQLRTYSPVSYFDIGKKACQGTINVYINGQLDPLIKYESTSGFVTLSKNVSETDKIYITWEEDSSDLNYGSINTGIGFLYNKNKNLTYDTSLSLRWPVSLNSTYSTYDNNLAGYTALSGGIKYNLNGLTIHDAVSLSLENPNTTGKYLVNLENTNDSNTYYFSKNAGVKTKNVPELNNGITLSKENEYSEIELNGFYDSTINGIQIPVNWDFTNAKTNESAWASKDLYLPEELNLFSCEEFEIALKSQKELNGYRIFLQFHNGYSNQNVPTFEISNPLDSKIITPFESDNKEWQIIRIIFDENDRLKLADTTLVRIILLKENLTESDLEKGTLFAGPFEPVLKNSLLIHDDNIYAQSKIIERKNDLSLTQIDFQYLDKNLIHKKDIDFISYFQNSDFSIYKYITLDFAVNYSGNFKLILDNSSFNPYEYGQKALELSINENVLKNYVSNKTEFHKLKIDVKENQVYIDNKKINKNDVELIINKSVVPNRQICTFTLDLEDDSITKGSVFIGKLFYEENSASTSVKNYFETNYNYKNDKLSTNTTFYSTQKASAFFEDDFSTDALLDASLSSNLSLKKLYLDTALSFSTSSQNKEKNIFDNGSHQIKTNEPLFNILNFYENFSFSNLDKTSLKSDFIKFDFSKINIPLNISYITTAKDFYSSKNQNQETNLNLDLLFKKFSIILNSKLILEQKENAIISKTDNYFISWLDTTKMQFSPGFINSNFRNITFSNILSSKIKDSNFTPSLEYTLNNDYTNTITTENKNNASFSLKLPFTFSKTSLSIINTKTAGQKKYILSGGNYFSDFNSLFTSQKDYSFFYTSLPVLDLFLPAINNQIQVDNYYSTNYDLVLKNKLNNSIKDLFIPASFKLSISRDIYKNQKLNDIYQIKINAANQVINLLSSKNKGKLFNQNELSLNNTLIIKLPEFDFTKSAFTFNSNSNLLLYSNNDNTIKTALDFNIDDEKNWNLTSSLIWNHSSNKIPFIKNKNLTAIRKEIFNLNFNYISQEFLQQYEYYHNLNVKINKTISANANLGLILLLEKDKATNLNTEITLGIKTEF